MSDASPVMLKLEGVSHSYHARRESFDRGIHHVLNDVSLEIRRGETLGVIGRNGAGKTTMLRLMAGILAPNKGRVWQQPGSASALLTIGLGFRPELSGRDNAMLSAILQGSSRAEATSLLDEIKAFSELGDSFDEPVKTYSAGMRARLGFSTALITHVDILLIDEVLSVGDASFREKARAAMTERIAGEQTVVFVSHMDSQVSEFCDRAIWLEQGKIAASGEVGEVLERYRQAVGKPPQAQQRGLG